MTLKSAILVKVSGCSTALSSHCTQIKVVHTWTGNFLASKMAGLILTTITGSGSLRTATCLGNNILVSFFSFMHGIETSSFLVYFCCVMFRLCRFNPELALEKLRGKRLLFAGDSLQRNQWESFVCMVEWTIPPEKKSMKRGKVHSVFKAKVLNY